MQTTITHQNIQLEVEYIYEPYEAQTLEYPGSPENVEVEEIYYNGTDVYKIYEENDLLEEISDLILKDRKDDEYDYAISHLI